MFLLNVFFVIIFREEKMMNIFSKFKVALLGAILSFGLVASIGTKGVSEASAAGETEPATVTDVITADSLKLTGTTYLSLDKVGVNKSSSALYSGNVARVKISDTEFGIKMSKNKKYGLVTTISGGVLKSVTVEWFKNVEATLEATLNVYYSASSFANCSDLYLSSVAKPQTVAIPLESGSSTINFTDDNIKFFGVASGSGMIYLNKITVEWAPSTFGTLDSVTVTNSGTTRYVVGEAYSSEGVAAIKTDTNGNQAIIDSTDIKTKLDGHTFTEADVPSMTNAVTYEGKESAPFNIEVYSKSSFEKVTATKDDWTGTYIIVSQKGEDYFAFDSSSGDVGSSKKVTNVDGKIEDAIYLSVKIEKYLTGYSIQSYNGGYIGLTSLSTPIKESKENLLNSISFDGADGISINCPVTSRDGTTTDMFLRFDDRSNQMCFKYYVAGNTMEPISLYEYKATESTPLTNWANQINDTLTCYNGINPPDVEAWNNIKTTYFDNVIKGVDLETIRNEVANSNGTNLQKALAKYDYIISKYGDKQYQNYLERNISIGKANIFGITSNSNLPLISILSLMGIGSILGVTFLLKKKKENN